MDGQPPQPPAAPYQVLLDVAEAIAAHRDLGDLFHDLAGRLHSVVQFDYLNLILHDDKRNVMRLHTLETSRPTQIQPGLEIAVEWSAAGHVFETQQPLIVPDIGLDMRFPKMREILLQERIVSYCILPLTTAQHRLGCLGFGHGIKHEYTAAEIEFMRQVARQVAVAVDNAINYEKAQRYQKQLAAERDHLRVLLEVNNAVISNQDKKDRFTAIAESLRRVLHHDYTSMALHDPVHNVMRLRALVFPEGHGYIREEMEVPVETSLAGICYSERKALLLTSKDFANYDAGAVKLLQAEGVRSLCCVPLVTRNRALGAMTVASFQDDAFKQQDLDLLTEVGNQVAIAVENAQAFEEIAQLKNKLAEEKLYLEDEIRTEFNFEEIIGESTALKNILKQVGTVAPTDSTVLIQGETGTGKELIARAIHNLSSRKDGTFVKINCAAIPTGLLESELFGHERGAFHWRHNAKNRQIRTGGPRLAVPRRNWRYSAGASAETVACFAGTGI